MTASLAQGLAARLKKELPVQKKQADALLADIKRATGLAKKKSAESCFSLWGELIELTKRAEVLKKGLAACLDDSELVYKHNKEIPSAKEILIQVHRLVDVTGDISKALQDLEKEAKRISSKADVLKLVEAEIRDPKLQVKYMKKFEAAMDCFSLLVPLVLVYKKLAGKKVSIN